MKNTTWKFKWITNQNRNKSNSIIQTFILKNTSKIRDYFFEIETNLLIIHKFGFTLASSINIHCFSMFSILYHWILGTGKLFWILVRQTISCSRNTDTSILGSITSYTRPRQATQNVQQDDRWMTCPEAVLVYVWYEMRFWC